jgi:manganese transport protein
MGAFASRGLLRALAWACAAAVIGLNGVLVCMSMNDWADALDKSGASSWWVYGTLAPVVVLLVGFLGWLMVYPRLVRRAEAEAPEAAPVLGGVRYGRIGVAVEFAGADDGVLAQAAALARSHRAELVVLHVVEGTGAALLGPAAADQESRKDRTRMADLVEHLRRAGLTAEGALGYGRPVEELVRIARERRLDLLVMGTHGHRFLADLALGQTVSPVLHRLTIPVLVVPTRGAATPSADGAPV